MTKLQSADGNFRVLDEALEGEPLIDEFKIYRFGACLPNILRWILCTFVLDYRKAAVFRPLSKCFFFPFQSYNIYIYIYICK